MRNRIIYGIIKTYKGIFIKNHIGNIHIIIIEMRDSFIVLNLLGEMEDETIAAQMILRASSEYINIFIDQFEESENFIQLEEIICDIPIQNHIIFKVILKKKGKYLNSNYTIKLSDEYSEGSIRIYIIEGKITVKELNDIDNDVHLRMKAMKEKSIVKPLLNKFKASIKR